MRTYKQYCPMERFGVVTITLKPDGHGSYDDLTEAGVESLASSRPRAEVDSDDEE